MPGIVHAVVYAKDTVRLSRFYEAVADFAPVCRDDDHVELAAGDARLVVHAIPHAIADGIALADPLAPREDAAVKLVLPVRSLAAARALAAEAGGRVEAPDREWGADGGRACNAIDPEGNVVLLRERESAPDDDPTALEALETSLWREETRYDRAHIDRVLADDFVEIGRSGRVWTREAITSLPRAPIDAVLPLPGFSVRRLGQDIALATYESRVQREGAFERAHRCSLWSRTDGRWRLRFHQATPTAEP